VRPQTYLLGMSNAVTLGPRAPRALRSRHCDCHRLGMLRAECLMPDSGVVDESMLEAFSTNPPEGAPRTANHAYVFCIDLVRGTADCDW
jgi:hypothetical protein